MTDDTPTTDSTRPTESTSTTEPTGDSDAPPDDEQAPAPDALRDYLTPLATIDPDADAAALDALPPFVADAEVVGLGEATHGTREFFRAKHRLLRWLVERQGARTFALEATFAAARSLDDYVTHGRGTAEAALADLHVWPWKTEAVRDLVEWLRAFNADRPVDDRVRVHGVDAQYTEGGVAALRDYLGDVDPAFRDRVAAGLDRLDDGGTPPHQDDGIDGRLTAGDRVLPRVRSRLDAERDRYVDAAGADAWALARQHLRTVEQALACKAASRDWVDCEDDTDAIREAIRVRDRSMATNVAWVTDRAAAGPTVVWGHDAHINRERHVHRDSGAAATPAGGHLAATYGDDYVALGFAFGRGAFQAIGETDDGEYELRRFALDDPLPDTVDARLAALDVDAGVLNLRAAAADDRLAGWLADPTRHLSLGAVFDGDDLETYVTAYTYAEAFDALWYVDETSRARPLDDRE